MSKSIEKLLILLAAFLSLTSTNSALADEQPVFIPNLAELCNCQWIAVVEYKGFTAASIVTPSNPPTAMYRIKKQLRGLRYPSNSFLPVIYEFDRSTDIADPQSKSKKQEMPTKGSKWILFLPEFAPNYKGFRTWEGSKGRIEYSDANLKAVLAGMKQQWQAQRARQSRQPAQDGALQPGEPP